MPNLKKKKHQSSDIVIRRFRTDKRTGKVYDAWDYGYKGWPIRVKR